jgi:hypothetical protein
MCMPRACRAAQRVQAAQYAWDFPALGSGLAATLQVVDVCGCSNLTSLGALRSCVQLRCLRMPSWVSVLADLAPLGACSQLEELWMARNFQVTSLAPLKACPRLRKLDIRSCRHTLQDQVEDLRLSCKHLADPKTVEIEGLVLDLQPDMPPGAQAAAAGALSDLASTNKQTKTAIANTGAIPLLVQLRALHHPAHVREAARRTLRMFRTSA